MKELKSMDNQNLQRTLAIIKPDAFAQKLSGKIVDRIEQEGLSTLGALLLLLGLVGGIKLLAEIARHRDPHR